MTNTEPHHGYRRNANGTRTALLKPGGRVSAYYDAQDRLLAYGDITYTYTANGELRTKTDASGTTTYTYDALGNLLGVALPDGKVVDYVVDAEGRRIAKKVNGAIERKWLYRDSLKPIAELDASGDVVALYGYAEKYTTPSFVERDGQRYRVISDHLGSPRLVVNAASAAGRPVAGEYAGFGEVTGSGGGWMPFGFAGGLMMRIRGSCGLGPAIMTRCWGGGRGRIQRVLWAATAIYMRTWVTIPWTRKIRRGYIRRLFSGSLRDLERR